MTDEVQQHWGPFCYLRGVIDVVSDLQTYRIRITCDDGPEETIHALNAFVAKGKFSGGGLAVSPDAALDDGLVDVVKVRKASPQVIGSAITRTSPLSSRRYGDGRDL